MELLNPKQDVEKFFARVKRARKRLLLLDYDGTLAPFREERNQAVPYRGVKKRLKQILSDERTRLVIVSGRWSEDLLPLLKMKPHPEIWGCHGAERVSPDNKIIYAHLGEDTIRALATADAWAEQEGLDDVMERKPAGLAFHWRGLRARRIKEIRETVRGRWEHDAFKAGLAIHEFDGGIEMRAARINKGQAVRTMLEEIGARTPVAYLGDDFTDEDAFEVLDKRGLKILVRPEKRETRADIWIKPPKELLQFLDRWIKQAE